MKKFVFHLLISTSLLFFMNPARAQWSLTGNAGTNPAIHFVGTTDGQPLLFKTNAQEAMRISSSQMIGIGTASPGYRLQIENDKSTRSLSMNNSYSTNSTKYGVYNIVDNAGSGGRYGIYNRSTSSTESAATAYGIYNSVTHPGQGIAYGLYSFVSTSGAGLHYGIYSSSSGASNYAFYGVGRGYFSDKVGLGITDPVGQLHIKNVEVDLTSGGSIILGETNGVNMAFDANEIHARNNGVASTLYVNPLGGTVVINNAGTVTDASLTSDGALRIGDNSGTNLIFDNNEIQARNNGGSNNLGLNVEGGNVCIGTWSGTDKLNVCGTIKAKEIRVESGWCDYVFDQHYDLKPLHEVAQYIASNKHLPNIPPASEVENGGLSLGDMTKRMMEKIEELTLYVIQQQEQIQALRDDNLQMHSKLETLSDH